MSLQHFYFNLSYPDVCITPNKTFDVTFESATGVTPLSLPKERKGTSLNVSGEEMILDESLG